MAVETNNKLVQVVDLVNFATKNDTLYPRKAAVTAEIEEAVAAQISSVYKPAGSVADIDTLPALTEANLGKLVNVAAAFTTTEDFLEGKDVEYPAGTNVAVVLDGEDYKYDAMSGVFDSSALATNESVTAGLAGKVDKLEGMGLSTNDYTDADKTKLAGLEIASSADVAAAIDAALGITAGGNEEEPGGGE